MPAPADLAQRLAPFEQQHVLRFWDELPPADQAGLVKQLAGIDLGQLSALFKGEIDQPDWHAVARKAEPPVAVRLAERRGGEAGALGVSHEQAVAEGRRALAAGEVGMLLVAGGQGSRLGFDRAKGLYPIGAVSGATLLQVHIEKAVALAKRYGRGVPVYLMTSPITHDEQLAFLAENDRFGLAEDDLFVFCQGTMPAVDRETGRLLLGEPGKLFLSPDGHGGTIAALASSGATLHMRRRGVKQLFYWQVDNPLVPIGDAELVGYHRLAQSELTSIAVAKTEPHDKLGNFVTVDGKQSVIEYSDFPDDVATQRSADGSLRFWAGSIAVHVFEASFLERVLALKDSLPFHVAVKKVPYVATEGPDAGKLVEPADANALKFERFIFDLLPQAARPLVVEYAEAEVFAPLKNASGAPKDTPEYVRQFLIAQHLGWLEGAGVAVPAGAQVEISPLWGLDA
ncbi:MAG: UTP--glucose-1-phosphate uridylyltransferase, partial [Lacipirellulaceae bacterium]